MPRPESQFTGRSRLVAAALLAVFLWHPDPAPAQMSLDEFLQQYPGEAEGLSALLSETQADDASGYLPNQYAVRTGLGHAVGRSVGVPGSFTTLEAFIPIAEESGSSLMFVDVRGHVDNFGDPAFNFGVGQRLVLSDLSTVFGWSTWYDYRSTARQQDFHQLGLGLELLTDWIEFRGNVYLPGIGNERQSLTPRFTGNSLLINRAEVAMNGADGEVAVVLPPLGILQSRLAAGAYWFDDEDVSEAAGWKARAEIVVSEHLTAGVSFQDDDTFGSTTLASISVRSLIELASPSENYQVPAIDSYRRGSDSHLTRSAVDRLADPVTRFPFVVTGIDDGEIATDPGTGAPLLFIHAVPGATTGNGTFERPWGTLTAALADPQVGQARIYTPSGGAFTENVTMVAGSRLLSNAAVQMVATQSGGVRLPFSGAGQSQPGAARINGNVTLSSDVELNGFQINGGVGGDAVSSAIIERNQITNPGGAGIALTNITNTPDTRLVIQGNTIADGSSSGITLSGTDLAARIEDNIANSTTVAGLGISGTSFTGNLTGNTFSNSDGTGIVTTLSGSFTGMVSGNTASGNALNGFEFDAGQFDQLSSTADLFASNIASMNGGNGLAVTVSSFNGNISNNTFSDNGGNGFLLESMDWTGTLSGNTASGNDWNGFLISSGTFLGTIRNNTLTSNQSEGIQIVQSPSAMLNSEIQLIQNMFIGNNGTQREFLLNNVGPGGVEIMLNQNSSGNRVTSPNFNFDIIRDELTAGDITVLSTRDNSGTAGRVLGSSDGSVADIPAN